MNLAGSKEMIQLHEILLKAPGVLGARFSGAGFRGCCLAIVDSERAEEAAAYVRAEYEKAQPELVSKIPADLRVLVCEPGDSACVILPDHDSHC
jgi:galacturonokinase